MNTASPPNNSNTSSWIEGIRAAGETAREKERLRDARLDKIIDELDSCDPNWYFSYTKGTDIALNILTCRIEENQRINDNFILQRKRAIVEQCIIPAMHACIRAGLLKPSDE